VGIEDSDCPESFVWSATDSAFTLAAPISPKAAVAESFVRKSLRPVL